MHFVHIATCVQPLVQLNRCASIAGTELADVQTREVADNLLPVSPQFRRVHMSSQVDCMCAVDKTILSSALSLTLQ